MPHMTAGFPFEDRIFTWAQGLVQRMAQRRDAGFILQFGADAVVRLTVMPTTAENWRKISESERDSESYILYDPFDFPEWAHLRWRGVKREMMESLIAAKFQEADFLPVKYGDRQQQLPERSYPTNWSVTL
jgi:hypothetical protein